MRSITIGINALFLLPGRVGGTEIYLRELLHAIGASETSDRFIVFTNRETSRSLEAVSGRLETVVQPLRAAFRPARIVWEQTGLICSIRSQRIDVLFNPGFTAPIAYGGPMVAVFHDLQHKRHPEYFRWHDLPFWQLLLWASAHRSRALIAPSEATASDLRHYYGIQSDKIRVIPHGVNETFFEIAERRRGLKPQKYILTVSTLHPHKNLERLIRAFAVFRQTRPDIDLVIIGLHGFVAQHLMKLVAHLGVDGAVRFTGWIPQREVYDYFAGALAFVYPSLFEGFGMPVLEALAAGIPSACSAIQPLVRLSDGACLHFDPGNETEILQSMHRLVADSSLRAELAIRGPKVARAYSWQKAAGATLAILRQALS